MASYVQLWKGKIHSSSVFVVVAWHTQDEVDGNIRTRGISSKIVPLRLRQHFFFLLCLFTKGKIGSRFFLPSLTPRSTMLNTCCSILSWVQLLNCITNKMLLNLVKATWLRIDQWQFKSKATYHQLRWVIIFCGLLQVRIYHFRCPLSLPIVSCPLCFPRQRFSQDCHHCG